MEYVGAPRLQLNIVSRPGPRICLVGKQIVNAKGLVRLNPELCKVQVNPSCLRILMVKVYYHQNDVFLLRIGLAVADEIGLVGGMEAKAAIAVQRSMLSSDFVDAGDQRPQICGSSIFQCRS
jgi:hypothetical protein